MCTAATYTTKDHYFGRNLDLECSYNENVVVVPRNFPLNFKLMGSMERHYAMIGMALVMDGTPLFYDATNEKGLSIAGLNFPHSAFYGSEQPDKDNIAAYEIIPWLLGQCADLSQVRRLLDRMALVDMDFAPGVPPTPLHWMIADQSGSIVAEPTAEGLKVYDDPVGVLTNEPPFPFQMFHLNDHMQLSCEAPRNSFAPGLELKQYCLGMGAMGLPGDLSSASRFVKAAFTRMNSVSGDDEAESVSQFFHILGSVFQQRGCVHIEDDKYEITVYSSCCNMDKGIYYYNTYGNSQIGAVDMHHEDLEGSAVISYPLCRSQQFAYQN